MNKPVDDQSNDQPGDDNQPGKEKPGKKRPNKAIIIILIVAIGLFLFLIIYTLYEPAAKPATAQVFDKTSTPTLVLSPTCQPNMELATQAGLNPPTKLIVIVYDTKIKVIPELDFSNGEKTTDVATFVSKIIPDLMGPGDEISVFQLGYSTYPAARVTRQYSYLTIYPQLYVAPKYATLSPLPPTGVPTPGYGEVATKNAFIGTSTARAVLEAANSASYNCQVLYYNANIRSTATAWEQSQVADINSVSTAEVGDFATVSPGNENLSELAFGGLYYGLFFATVDIKSDCAKYDECDLVIVDDLRVYGKHNPQNLPIALNGVNLYVIMPNCRDINQPDCAELQTYWTAEFQGFGINNITYWNGARAELNLLSKIGR